MVTRLLEHRGPYPGAVSGLTFADGAHSLPCMADVPTAITMTMIAVISGLMVYAALLLLGTRIVRGLRLPQELPEGPRFEPPPPPVATVVSREAAAKVAAQQAELRTLYDEAHQAVRSAFEIHECHQFLQQAGTDPAVVAAATEGSKVHSTASAACTTVEKLFSDFDTRVRTERSAITSSVITEVRTNIAEQAAIIATSLTTMKAVVAPHLGDQSNRRLIIMVVLLVVMIAWVIYMQTMMKP